jgi:D-2-hydroxyacid dehydrogenase (NADP+)
MATPIYIIDAMSEFYRSQLAGTFKEAEFRTAKDRRSVKMDQLGDVEAIVALGTPNVFDDELLGAAKKLRFVQALTTGIDGITGVKSLRPDVKIATNTGIHGPQMAEFAIMHMLNLSRSFGRIWENQKAARWERVPQIRLAGKTVVILGIGSISESLAPRCKALGMSVLGVSGTMRDVPGFDRVYPRHEMMEAVAQADYLVILVPGSPENRNLVDAKVLKAMKPSAYLINLARGSVLDYDALIDALKNDRLAGAGLDVFPGHAPLPPDHPLWKADKVLLTPNIAGGSEVNHLLNAPIVNHNVRCFLEGNYDEMINLARK